MKIRFAVSPASNNFDPASYRRFVEGLEARHFDTVWLSDIPLSGGIDPIVGLALAAAWTTRLKLGANIVPFGRLHLAKQLAQLQRASQGRLLLTIVPGIGTREERESLGVSAPGMLETMVAQLREHWATDSLQPPLELWLGGRGPKALERAGRIAEGWLGSALDAAEVREARATIDAAAESAGRTVDPEHFGMSIPCARVEPAGAAAVRARRPEIDPEVALPVGTASLLALVEQYVAAGCSKFVVHPLPARSGEPLGEDDLDWLAETLLPIQT